MTSDRIINVAERRNVHYTQHGAWIPDDAFDPTIPVSEYNIGPIHGTWYPSMDRCAVPECQETVALLLVLRRRTSTDHMRIRLPPPDRSLIDVLGERAYPERPTPDKG